MPKKSRRSKKKVTSDELSDSGADYQDPDSESDESIEEPKRMQMPALPKTTAVKTKTTAVKTMDAPTNEREPWPLLNLEDSWQRDQPFHSPVRPIKVPDGYLLMVHMLHGTDCSNYKIRRDVNDRNMILIICDSFLKDKEVSDNCHSHLLRHLLTPSYCLLLNRL